MDKKISPASSLPATSVRHVEVGREQQGQRLDNFLIKTLKNLPRTRLYRLIRKGEVRVNKKRVKPEYKLCPGDIVRIPPLRLAEHDDQRIVIPDELLDLLGRSILYENDSVLIVDKPAGLAVHSGSGVRYGLIDAMRRLRPDCPIELVHRLDRDTSGCLLLAKHRQALLAMQRLLRSDALQKHYVAVVRGHWPGELLRIDTRLKRVTMPNGENKVFADEAGQAAETLIEAVRYAERDGLDLSWLDIRLMSGRTHQIRVHCQNAGHEIGGDAKYGDREFNRRLRQLGCKRLMLHAGSLDLPATDHTKAINVVAPLPAEFKLLFADV